MITRPRFQEGAVYIAVRPLRVGSDVIAPGAVVPTLPNRTMRALYYSRQVDMAAPSATKPVQSNVVQGIALAPGFTLTEPAKRLMPPLKHAGQKAAQKASA